MVGVNRGWHSVTEHSSEFILDELSIQDVVISILENFHDFEIISREEVVAQLWELWYILWFTPER